MLDQDGIDIAADSRVAVSEDTSDAFEFRPNTVFDVDWMTLCQLLRHEIGCLELGEV